MFSFKGQQTVVVRNVWIFCKVQGKLKKAPATQTQTASKYSQIAEVTDELKNHVFEWCSNKKTTFKSKIGITLRH